MQTVVFCTTKKQPMEAHDKGCETCAFYNAAHLKKLGVNADNADYVIALATPAGTALSASAKRGSEIFGEQCVACHGAKGEGVKDFGAPRLNDAIWLYGGDRAALIQQISAPRQGVMPAWSGRLSEAQIKMLTLYVHSLGGGQ